MVKIGEQLPAATLREYVEVAGEGCPVGPASFELAQAAAGKTIAIFAVPGAFTPTCSEKHVPGFIARAEALRAAGVDEIWCVAVNDPFVMGAWGRASGAGGALRMVSDGNGDFTRAVGLSQDMSARGLGLRSQRYSMLVRDGVVRALNVEAPGKFEVSDADTLLGQAQALKG